MREGCLPQWELKGGQQQSGKMLSLVSLHLPSNFKSAGIFWKDMGRRGETFRLQWNTVKNFSCLQRMNSVIQIKLTFFVVVDRLYCSFTVRLKKHCSEALWLYAYFIQLQMFYRLFGHFTTDLYGDWNMNMLSIKKSLEFKSSLESMVWAFRSSKRVSTKLCLPLWITFEQADLVFPWRWFPKAGCIGYHVAWIHSISLLGSSWSMDNFGCLIALTLVQNAQRNYCRDNPRKEGTSVYMEQGSGYLPSVIGFTGRCMGGLESHRKKILWGFTCTRKENGSNRNAGVRKWKDVFNATSGNGIFLSIWSPNNSKISSIPLESAIRSEGPYQREDLMGKMGI